MEFADRGNGYTYVTVKFVQYLEWKILKIQDGTPPNPATGGDADEEGGTT